MLELEPSGESTSRPGAQRSWYLVHTKPRQENIAALNLQRQNYEIYLPQIRERRVRHGNRQEVIEPLFQRYLFIHLDSRLDNWSKIRSTIGVSSLVRFGNEPARVPTDLVDFLKSRQNDEGLHEWAQTKLAVGDRAVVVSGPLAGYEGILLTKDQRGRAVILLALINGHVRAKVSQDQIEPPAR